MAHNLERQARRIVLFCFIGIMPPTSKKARFEDCCQVCGELTTHLFRHMRRAHLPWYLDPASACIDCHMSAGTRKDLHNVHGTHQGFIGEAMIRGWFLLINGLFLFLSQQIGIGSPIELLGCAVVRELSPHLLRFSEDELFFLREFDSRAGLEPVSSSVYMSVPPTRLIALTHPELMTRLVSQINHQAVSQLKWYTRYSLADGSSLPDGYPTLKRGIIDTHFHLDKLSVNKCISLSDLEASNLLKIRLPFAIANYVFPDRWYLLGVKVRADTRLRFTLGIHPHLLTGSEVYSYYGELERMLHDFPEAVGIGEVGLDYTTSCRHRFCYTGSKSACKAQKIKAQKRFLRLCLQLAKRENKVLVLHVRDGGSGEAALDVLNLIKELKMEDHPIHRHCFVGGEQEYKDWSSDLPNCYFSISPVTVLSSDTMNALRTLGNRKRLLLETDADYLAEFPWSVCKVAEDASRSLGMTMTELVGVCNKNAARLYNLPW